MPSVALENFPTKTLASWNPSLKFLIVAASSSIEYFLQLGDDKKTTKGIEVPEESVAYISATLEKYGDFINCQASKRTQKFFFVDLSLIFYAIQVTKLEDLIEDMLLAWRDSTKDSLAMGFKVNFLLDHLWKLTCVLFISKAYSRELSCIDHNIEKFQQEKSTLMTLLEETKFKLSEVNSQMDEQRHLKENLLFDDSASGCLLFCSSLNHGLL